MTKIIFNSAILALVFTLVNSYNFDDSDFNEILAKDLYYLNEYINQPLKNVRNRRDEEAVVSNDDVDKCRPRKKKLCCAEDSVEAFHDIDRDLKKKCFKEVIASYAHDKDEPRGDMDPFRCDRAEKHRRDMICVMQCVGQQKGILSPTGNPIDDKFSDYFKDLFKKESWLQPMQDKIISTCLADAKNVTAAPPKAGESSCNPAGLKLAHCMFKEVQLACPQDQIKEDRSCSKLRDRLQKSGGDFFMPHHGPPPPPSDFD